jgi:U6 snRNA phosphodiesterase
MALVDYISSDEDETEDKNALGTKSGSPPANSHTLKRKRETHLTDTSELPPLPAKFHDLYASATRVSTRDDPSLHGGRKRITPHVEGNWPTHLYIECECNSNDLVCRISFY